MSDQVRAAPENLIDNLTPFLYSNHILERALPADARVFLFVYQPTGARRNVVGSS